MAERSVHGRTYRLPIKIRQARKVVALGDVPVHVITAGTFLNQPLVPAARRTELQQRWEDLQSSS
jgi:hypothetical protein